MSFLQRISEMKSENFEAMIAHFIALMLVSGFLGLGTIALLGLVDLKNPTTSAFAGTLLGYSIHRVEHAMQRYFGKNTVTESNVSTSTTTSSTSTEPGPPPA